MAYYFAVNIMPRDNTIRPEPAQISALVEAWRDTGPIVRPGSSALREMYRHELAHPGVETGAWYFPFGPFAYKTEPRASSVKAMWRWLMGRPPQKHFVWGQARPFPIPPDAEALAYLGCGNASIHFADSENRNQFGILNPLHSFPDELFNFNMHLQIDLHDDYIEETSVNVPGLQDATCKCGQELRFDDDRIHRTCPACDLDFRPQDQLVPIGDWTGNQTLVPGGVCHRFVIVVDCVTDAALAPQFSYEPKASDAFMRICSAALGIELYQVSSYGDG